MAKKFEHGKTYILKNRQTLEVQKFSIQQFSEDRYYIYKHSEEKGTTTDMYWFEASYDIEEILPDEKIIVKF